MSFYERLQRIHELKLMEVSGQDLPVTGISTSDYFVGLARMGCTIEDDIREAEEQIHILKNIVDNIKEQ